MNATEIILPGARAVVTHRGSQQLYGSFNACHYVGDEPLHVMASRIELAHWFDVPVENLMVPRQVHSARVAFVDENSGLTDDVDGLVTTNPDLVLCVHTADCVPLLMVDAEAGVVAAVHSGWRGTVAGIAGEAVRTMIEAGACPERIFAAMGPCIGTECFEVGEDVASYFDSRFVDRSRLKPHVNLAAAVEWQLQCEGVPAGQIASPIGCSRCDNERFFSARIDGIASGRTTSAIALRRS